VPTEFGINLHPHFQRCETLKEFAESLDAANIKADVETLMLFGLFKLPPEAIFPGFTVRTYEP
jgi:hypothetical protein